MRHYHRKDWQRFRDEVIDLDGGVCVRCRRGPLEGVVLQVHHKEYLPGRLPWQYPYGSCETLCKACHAGEHGIVRPFTGWECVGYDDLGEPSGECELCGNSIRYVLFVQHAKWPSLEVGETCCDHLTDTTEASDHMDSMRRFDSRQQRFIRSNRWKAEPGGAISICQKGTGIVIEPADQGFRLIVNEVNGKLRFLSIIDAKKVAFELLESGKIDAFFRKIKKCQS